MTISMKELIEKERVQHRLYFKVLTREGTFEN